MVKPLKGDGLTVERCEGCAGLSIVMLSHGEPIAFVCPPNEALVQLAALIMKEVIHQQDLAVGATETLQ